MTLKQQIITHAKQQYPNECCGLIVDGTYAPCTNVADKPTETFRISHDQWQPADIVVHSHPQGQRYLSGADRQTQHKMRCDWWIAVNNNDDWEIIKYRYTPLLRGRTFEYGKHDCYSIVEDAYMLCGIKIMDYQRKGEAIEIADNAFLVNFPKTGFYQVELSDMQSGDVILTSIRGNANHASIYLGDEQVLHHPYGGLSRREGFCDVWHKAMHSVWRHKDWQPDMMTAIFNDLEATR
ncbi:C40 family peptidase [Psychrobacter raelei]|uniref:C40 family peptidase n=1 Tax=Psychrobacter raelei TaxID=2565531 RepID=A0AAT9PFD4_9GAMM|nr:C40 family peptidase [Psychrobacter sp. PraFG1]UNK05849.1 C40 family peptidase [Psychrobacter sp. PraFG1]